MNRETCTAADAERALRTLQRDPAAQAYGDHLRRKGLLVPVPKPPSLLDRLLQLLGRCAVVITAPDPVIRTGRVLSQGCGR